MNFSCSIRKVSCKSTRYWVLSIIVYYKGMFVLDICIYRKKELSLSNRGIAYTSFGEILGIDIPEILLNIVPCYGFVQEYTPTVMLAFISKLVSYYLYRGFVMISKDNQDLKNTPNRVKQRTHVFDMYEMIN